jgi:hypothetical protein
MGRVFRRYVKEAYDMAAPGARPVYRIEETIAPNKPVLESVQAIRANFEHRVIQK